MIQEADYDHDGQVSAAERAHYAVTHPAQLLATRRGLVGRANDWAATHLSVMFGLVWTVWLFMVFPLLVLLFPKGVQNVTFYLASGWIQLWALPLFVYVGNRLQKSGDAQSDAQHEALTHIATTGDRAVQLLTELHDRSTSSEGTPS